jgi:hypothetical protein
MDDWLVAHPNVKCAMGQNDDARSVWNSCEAGQDYRGGSVSMVSGDDRSCGARQTAAIIAASAVEAGYSCDG